MSFRTVIVISLLHMAQGLYESGHIEASEKCKGHGGLATYEHFLENAEENVEDDISLGDGDSAWIYGNVVFSKFISWHGCYDGDTSKIQNYMLEENNLFNCLEKCNNVTDVKYEYIGLQNERCYCITWNNLQEDLLEVKNDSECQPQLIEPYYHINNGDQSLQTKINFYIIIFGETPEGSNQCVYVQNEGNSVKYGTESCHSQTKGFICAGSAYHALNDRCSKYYRFELPFCVVHKQNNWLTSYEDCGKYFGKLQKRISDETSLQLHYHKKYWTGIFRSFKLFSGNVPQNRSVCLSVTKVNGKLFLDPADCSTEKRFICEDNISGRKLSTTTEPTQDISSSELSSSVVTTIKPKQIEGERGKTEIYVVVGVALISAIILAALLSCFIVQKRRKQLKREQTKNGSDNTEHKTTTKDSGDGESACVANGALTRQVQVHHTEVINEADYATADQELIESYPPDIEYDRVGVNEAGRPNDKAASSAFNNSNIYIVHTGKTRDVDTDEYDHIGNVGANHQAKTVDGIYNTTNAESDTYNVLSPDIKIKPSTNKATDKSSDIYDKLI